MLEIVHQHPCCYSAMVLKLNHILGENEIFVVVVFLFTFSHNTKYSLSYNNSN